MFVCLFAVNAKTTERIDAKRSGITKNYPESVLCGLKSPVLALSGRYNDISGFSLAADRHFYLSSFQFRLLLRRLNKEELKTVGRDILTCAQRHRHEIFTAHWSPYRRVSSRGRRAQIRFGQGARDEKPENDRPPFWFYGESIRTSVHGSHIVLL